MKRLCTLAALALLALGCGKDDEDYRKKPGNNGAVQPQKGKPVKKPGADVFFWPGKTFAEVKDALSTGENVYDEKRVDACIEATGKLAAVKAKHKGDAKATMEKSLSVLKAAGFKDFGEYAAAQGKLVDGFTVFQQMKTIEKMAATMSRAGPGAVAFRSSKGGMLKSLRKNIKDLKLTEADLRLLHKNNEKLVGSAQKDNGKPGSSPK